MIYYDTEVIVLSSIPQAELYYWEYNPQLHFQTEKYSSQAMYFLASGILEQISSLRLILETKLTVFDVLFGFLFLRCFFFPSRLVLLCHTWIVKESWKRNPRCIGNILAG